MAEVSATHWDENGGGWPVERFARSFSADQSQFLITPLFSWGHVPFRGQFLITPLFSWGHVPFRASAIGGAGEFSEEANLDACSRFTLLTESYGGGGRGLAGVFGKLLVWRTKQSGVACHRKPASLGFSEVSSVSD